MVTVATQGPLGRSIMPFSVHPIEEGVTASFFAIWKRMISPIRNVVDYSVAGNIIQSVGFWMCFPCLPMTMASSTLSISFGLTFGISTDCPGLVSVVKGFHEDVGKVSAIRCLARPLLVHVQNSYQPEEITY